MLVRRMLQAARIGMRDPDRGQAEPVAEMLLGSEPPRFGRIAGEAPMVCAIEAATRRTQGLSGSSLLALNNQILRVPDLHAVEARLDECERTAGTTASGSTPTGKRNCSSARARGGMA